MSLSIIPCAVPTEMQVSGALDIYEADSARNTLLSHLGREAALHLDLSAVDRCDAAGVQLLSAARRTAAALGKRFEVSAWSPAVTACLAQLGMTPAL